MRKPGIDESNVQQSDVLCDFCEREWNDEIPMLEGHQGSCICGNCLSVAFTDVVLNGNDTAPGDYTCPMCLEASDDRSSLGRSDEPAWRSPLRAEAVICRRCIKLAAGALHKDTTFDWQKPRTP